MAERFCGPIVVMQGLGSGRACAGGAIIDAPNPIIAMPRLVWADLDQEPAESLAAVSLAA